MKHSIFLFLVLFVLLQSENTLSYSPGLNSTAYAYYTNCINSSTLIRFKLGTPGTVSVIGTSRPYYFGVGDWGNPAGTWNFYVCDNTGSRSVFNVDTATGNITNLGAMTGITSGHTVVLMAWDYATSKFFVMSSNQSASQLYSLTWPSFTLTAIGGSGTTCAYPVTGGFNNSGLLHVIDRVTGNIYRISKTTGVATLIGTSGVSMSAVCDGAFDRNDNKFYCSIPAGTFPRLLEMNSTLGNSAIIGVFPYDCIAAMCVISFNPISVIYNSEHVSDYKLYNNYPNPFNPSTRIKFDIPVKSNVRMIIYEITGREVAVLVNETLTAGTYYTDWNAGRNESGVYYCLFEAGTYRETKKMILIK